MKAVLLILDGIGDRPWAALDMRTPLGAAATPNLDQIAQRGATGILHSLGPGRAPGSELAHWSLFGYPIDRYPGRAIFEAAGAGIELAPGEVGVHVTTVTVRPDQDGKLPTASRTWGEQALPITEALSDLADYEAQGLALRLHRISATDALIVLSGPASPDITDTDPHNLGWPVGRIVPLADASDPAAAARTAAALNAWLDEGWSRLSGISEPGEDVPFVVLKWAGRQQGILPFESLTGMRGHIISAGGVFEGIATSLGMEHSLVPSTSDMTADLEAMIASACTALDDGADFVHIHDKEPDKAGHMKNPAYKRDVIEKLDAALHGVASGGVFSQDTVLAVTGDHGTPAGTELIHSGDPVPIVIRSTAVEPDAIDTYSESACALGSLGHLRGSDLMPLLLNARGTARYLSGRLTQEPGLHWPRPGQYETYEIPEQRG